MLDPQRSHTLVEGRLAHGVGARPWYGAPTPLDAAYATIALSVSSRRSAAKVKNAPSRSWRTGRPIVRRLVDHHHHRHACGHVDEGVDGAELVRDDVGEPAMAGRITHVTCDGDPITCCRDLAKSVDPSGGHHYPCPAGERARGDCAADAGRGAEYDDAPAAAALSPCLLLPRLAALCHGAVSARNVYVMQKHSRQRP